MKTKSFTMLAVLIAACAAPVAAQSPFSVFYDDFSTATGWTPDAPNWQIAPATPSTGHTTGVGFLADPGYDADGVPSGMLAGVVVGGNAGTVLTPRQYLTSPVIPTAGLPIGMSYMRFLNSDYPNFMNNGIDVFDETSMTWITIWTSGGTVPFIDDHWTSHALDLSSYASNSMQVRFWYEIGAAGVYNVPSWSIDNFDVFLLVPGNGQAAQPGIATLDVNGSAYSPTLMPVSSGDAGIYNTEVTPGEVMVLEAVGSPNNPWVLLAGVPAANATSIAPFGQIDLGTAGFGGLEVIGSGLDAGFLNAFFFTDANGVCRLEITVPFGLNGITFGLQGIMIDPVAIVVPTNAVAIRF